MPLTQLSVYNLVSVMFNCILAFDNFYLNSNRACNPTFKKKKVLLVLKLVPSPTYSIRKVKAHAGIKGNEKADM